MKKIEYANSDERDSIIASMEADGYLLLEEKNITEGNFLIFGIEDDMPSVEPTKLELLVLKISNLEQENLNIMLATTEMYEEQYNENINLMLAITELYEMNMEV